MGPESKTDGANMGPIWGRQDPVGPHVGPMNFAIGGLTSPNAVIVASFRFKITAASPKGQWVKMLMWKIYIILYRKMPQLYIQQILRNYLKMIIVLSIYYKEFKHLMLINDGSWNVSLCHFRFLSQQTYIVLNGCDAVMIIHTCPRLNAGFYGLSLQWRYNEHDGI